MENSLTQELTSALSSGKHKKDVSESHKSRNMIQAEEKASPKLTYDLLRQDREKKLPDPANPLPGYKYTWLSMDKNAVPNYYKATTKLGYSPVTVEEQPEMLALISMNAMDTSLTNNLIRVHEMVLCKILEEDWLTLMTFNHHIQPAEQERDIYDSFVNAVNNRGPGARLLKGAELGDGERDEDTGKVPTAVRTGEGGMIHKLKPDFSKF